tara:strand:- start:5523 stop:6536 length:1014 start_codon:yes stop_codon:yes gene_type:complete
MYQINFYIILGFINFLFFYYHNKLALLGVPFDIPDKKRKYHTKPVLLSGGIIIFTNFLLLLFFYSSNSNLTDFSQIRMFDGSVKVINFIFFSVILFTLGFVDDKININHNIKLALLTTIISCFLFSNQFFIIKNLNISFLEYPISLKYLSIPFTILSFLLFINAFNMFDGINLQSSTYSLFFFTYFFINDIYSTIFLGLIFSVLFFMYLNYKNLSFMGDGGCFIISFIIGCFSIYAYNGLDTIKYADHIFFLMCLPGVDMLRVFIVRIFNKQNPLKPDRKHFHHILLNKYNYKKAYFFISLMIALCFILVIVKINILISFIIFLTLYTYLIIEKKIT